MNGVRDPARSSLPTPASSSTAAAATRAEPTRTARRSSAASRPASTPTSRSIRPRSRIRSGSRSTPGVRVLPRPGVVEVLEFPVVATSEIDGTVYLVGTGGRRGIGDAQRRARRRAGSGRRHRRAARATATTCCTRSCPAATRCASRPSRPRSSASTAARRPRAHGPGRRRLHQRPGLRAEAAVALSPTPRAAQRARPDKERRRASARTQGRQIRHTARASIASPWPTGPIFSAVFALMLT